MKILTHKPDNTAYAKNVYNCEKFFSFCDIDFYCVKDKHYNTREYFCHLKGTTDILKPLHINGYSTPEQVQEMVKQTEVDRLMKICTAKGELNSIRKAIDDGRWTSNADAFFCELMGEFELAENARKNRARIYAQRELEEQERKARELAEQQAQKESEEREKMEKTESAEQDLKSGKWFSAEGFELLAEKYGVKLPIKFIGWLREHCRRIKIERYNAEEKEKYILNGIYNTTYYYNKGHKSTTIYDYADKLAEAVGI